VLFLPNSLLCESPRPEILPCRLLSWCWGGYCPAVCHCFALHCCYLRVCSWVVCSWPCYCHHYHWPCSAEADCRLINYCVPLEALIFLFLCSRAGCCRSNIDCYSWLSGLLASSCYTSLAGGSCLVAIASLLLLLPLLFLLAIIIFFSLSRFTIQ